MRTKCILALPAASLLLIACGDVSSSPDRTSSRGFTRVASAQFEAPLNYISNQQASGPEVDLAKAVVEKINEERIAEGDRPFELTWASRTNPEMLDAVANGEAEFAVSVIGITPEAKKVVAFSDTYYTSEIILVGNPSQKKLEPGDLSGLRIGIREGSAVESWLRSSHADTDAVPYATLDQALLSLRRAEVHGVVGDRHMAAYALDTVTGLQRLEILPGILHTFEVGAAVSQGNTMLLNLINTVVAETRSDGSFAEGLSATQGDRIERVESRYTSRLERERLAVEPRQLVLRLGKDKANPFDLYKLANLRFTLTHNSSAKEYRSSRVSFKKRNGYSKFSVPPGEYTLFLPKYGLTLGEILVKPDDAANVNYNLRWKADKTITVLAASK